MANDIPPTKAELDARFSELYRRHLRDIYSYSYYRVGIAADGVWHYFLP